MGAEHSKRTLLVMLDHNFVRDHTYEAARQPDEGAEKGENPVLEHDESEKGRS